MDFGRLGIARNHYGARTRRLHIAGQRIKERILHGAAPRKSAYT